MQTGCRLHQVDRWQELCQGRLLLLLLLLLLVMVEQEGDLVANVFVAGLEGLAESVLGLRLTHSREELVDAVVVTCANYRVVLELVKYLVLVELLRMLMLLFRRLRDECHGVVPGFHHAANLITRLLLSRFCVPQLLVVLYGCQVERLDVPASIRHAKKAVWGMLAT